MRRISRPSKPYLLLVTVPTLSEAKNITSALLKARLAACVNVIEKVESFFRWRGSIDHARERLLVIKTQERHFPQIEKTVRKLHSYEVPEMIGWPIPRGHAPYLDWISSSTRK